MSEKKTSTKKRKTADQRVALIIKCAKKYKLETGNWPERRKISELTGISHSSVQGAVLTLRITDGAMRSF